MVKVEPASRDVKETGTSFSSGMAILSNQAFGLGFRAARSIPDVRVTWGTKVRGSGIDKVGKLDGIVLIRSVRVSWILWWWDDLDRSFELCRLWPFFGDVKSWEWRFA